MTAHARSKGGHRVVSVRGHESVRGGGRDREETEKKITILIVDVIVGILAEHRWKHLVQIGQLLPSQYKVLIFAWYIKISTRNERTWEMYRCAHNLVQIIIVVVAGVPPGSPRSHLLSFSSLSRGD